MIRRLDSNDDWTFGSGKGSYIGELEGLALRIKTQLREWTGDCFFALNRGVDWHLMDRQENHILRQIRAIIMGNREVLGTGDISIERTDDRKWKLNINVMTIYEHNLTLLEIYGDSDSSTELPPVVAPPPMFLIIVINGYPSSGAAAEGSVITITANEPADGFMFSHWESYPQVIFTNGSNEFSSPAYFVMGANQQTFTAVFVPSGQHIASQDGRLLISQDGMNIVAQETI